MKLARAERVGAGVADGEPMGTSITTKKMNCKTKIDNKEHKIITLCHYTFQLKTGPARGKPWKNRGARDGARRADGRIR
jgi:hypothetical protein